jgi:hypothetical protein
MYIVQNISDKEISLSDLKISLKPNQKIDLDLSYNRHNIEKSSSLSIGINKGIIKILRKDDIFSKTEEKNNTSITKDNLDEMEKRLSNLMESRLVKSETNVDNSYIQKILDGYDGKQFGDPNLINDDIFAIIPLVKADISPSDKKIISSAKYILSFQKENSSFGSPDLTASAIQAFLLLPASEEISDSIKRANLFLRNSQKSDGGCENTFSTRKDCTKRGFLRGVIFQIGHVTVKVLSNPTKVVAM